MRVDPGERRPGTVGQPLPGVIVKVAPLPAEADEVTEDNFVEGDPAASSGLHVLLCLIHLSKCCTIYGLSLCNFLRCIVLVTVWLWYLRHACMTMHGFVCPSIHNTIMVHHTSAGA